MLKNLTIFLLCMLLLTSCGNTENNSKSSYTNSLPQSEINSTSTQSTSQTKLNSEYQSLKDFQTKIYESQNLCAVAYLGYLDGDYSDIMAYLKEKEIFKEFSFLSDIKEENTVTASGGELYAIIPVDENIITVNENILDENDYTFKPGKKLLEISDNQIILLRGNFSDILPNFLITVSKNGEQLLEYNPCLSLKDGSLNSAEGIYDFTPYEILKSDNNF